MSTITTQPKSTQIASHRVRAGKRTYFFDVKCGPKGGLFLSLSETVVEGEGLFTRHRMLVYEDSVREFYEGLCEAIRSMREEQKRREGESAPAEVAEKAPSRKKAA